MNSKRIFAQIMFVFLLCLPPSCLFASEGIIQNNIPLNDSLAAFTYNSYYIDVPAGSTELTVTITNTSQDVDLFVRYETPFTEGTYEELELNSDFSSVEFDTSDELITITPETIPAIQEGRWYIAAYNFSEATADFVLTAILELTEESLPLPASTEAFALYKPIEQPFKSIAPSGTHPIGVGSYAVGGDNFKLHVSLENFSEPVDFYLDVYDPAIASSIYLFPPDLLLRP